MTNNKTTYRRLGDYIREVDVRNTDLRCSNLLGLSNAKVFIPSIANTIGTDLRSYKIVRQSQFAYVPVTSRNGDKITVALYNEEQDCIVSQAYLVFEVINHEKLLPEYLMMWFRRPEFDRYSRFKSHGSAREVFEWDEMCDVMLPVPSIEEQRRIVTRYQAIQNRIENNKKTIAKLEEAAQTLYRKMFVDGIDVERLPEGWRMGRYTDIVRLSGGGTPDTNNKLFWSSEIPFFSPSDVSYGYYSISTEKHISKVGLENCSSKLYPQNSIFITARGTVGEISMAGMPMAMNQSNYAINSSTHTSIYYLHQLTIQVISQLKKQVVGAVFSALVTKDFETADIVIPTQAIINRFESKAIYIYERILLLQKENEKLTEMLSLVMVGMGR